MDRNILFLCTGNSARSQMAEALLRKHAGDTFQVFSAGTDPRDGILPPIVKVMQEIGIDLSNHKPKSLRTYLGKKHFEFVIVVCADADKQCPSIFGNSRRLFWRFDNPENARGSEEEMLAFCRIIRDQINDRIIDWLKQEKIM